MLVWVAVIALLCSFGAGWTLSSFVSREPTFRALVTPLLGLSLVTSLFCLGDLFYPPSVNVFVTLFLVCGAGLIGRRPLATESETFGPMSKAVGVMVVGLSLAAWIFAVGSIQLFPDLEFLLWDLTNNVPGQRSSLMAAASLFGRDSWLGVLLLCGSCQVAVAMGAFGLARILAPDLKIAWPLVGLYILGATETGWLVFQKPDDVLIQLWGLGAFLLLQQDDPNRQMLAAPLMAALLLVCWPLTLALMIMLGRWRRMLIVFAVVGLVQNLILTGFSVGLLFAALAVLYQARKPGAISQPALSLCLVELVWGSQGLFGWAALSLEFGRYLERLWNETQAGQVERTTGGLSFSRRSVLIAASLLTFWLGVDGAETVINDVVLIGGQKEDVSHARLALPQTLGSWLVWRGPAYGVQEADRRARDTIADLSGRVVYLSDSLPDPRVAALLAVATNRTFAGWHREPDGPALERGCALFLFTNDTSALSNVEAEWVVRPDQKPVKVESPANPSWESDWVRVHLQGKKGEPSAIDSVLTALIEEKQPHEVPAASLIPFRVQLHNPTEHDLDLSGYRGVRFAPTYPHRQPLRPIDYPVAPLNLDSLPAQESVTVTAYLRTSIHPLDYLLGIHLTRADGTFQPLPVTQPFGVRSWRVELPLDYPFKDETS
jgi:hypothetical protein